MSLLVRMHYDGKAFQTFFPLHTQVPQKSVQDNNFGMLKENGGLTLNINLDKAMEDFVALISLILIISKVRLV